MTAPDYSDLDRIGYRVHPAAAAFDPYTDAELDALTENIRAHGVLNPITLDSYDAGARIIDGVHRARAVARIRAEGGKEFLPARRLPDGWDPAEWARANNDIRRHRPTVLEAAALTTTKPTGGRPETGEISPVMTRRQAAEKAGVSEDTIKHARKVVEKSPPEVQEAVEDGLVSVSDAASVADQPETAQLHALADVAAGTHRTLKKAAQANVEAPQPEPAPPDEQERLRKAWVEAMAALEEHEKTVWRPAWEAHKQRVDASPAGRELHEARTDRNRLRREFDDAETRVVVAEAAVEDWVEEHALDEYKQVQTLKGEAVVLKAKADEARKAWRRSTGLG